MARRCCTEVQPTVHPEHVRSQHRAVMPPGTAIACPARRRGEDPIIAGIEQKIAEWTHLPPENGEPIQVSSGAAGLCGTVQHHPGTTSALNASRQVQSCTGKDSCARCFASTELPRTSHRAELPNPLSASWTCHKRSQVIAAWPAADTRSVDLFPLSLATDPPLRGRPKVSTGSWQACRHWGTALRVSVERIVSKP